MITQGWLFMLNFTGSFAGILRSRWRLEVGPGFWKDSKQQSGKLLQPKKQKIIIVVDEAHLLRVDIFAELHTITQFDNDSKKLFSLVLAGQPNLLEKMTYRSSAPLASRVVARTHLSHLNQDQMTVYLEHHLTDRCRDGKRTGRHTWAHQTRIDWTTLRKMIFIIVRLPNRTDVGLFKVDNK